MGKKSTPGPDPHPLGWGCTLLLCAGCVAAVAVIAAAGRGSVRVFATLLLVPAAAGLLYRAYGYALLLLAKLQWARQGIHGVLVYSNSPHWQSHVERQWLPRLGNLLRTLNWSERNAWRPSLEVRLFRYFVGTQYNFNPAVIVLRGLRWPLVFRFFFAFRDAKHGNNAALQRLEKRLYSELSARPSNPSQRTPPG